MLHKGDELQAKKMNTAVEFTADTQATFANLVEQGVWAYMQALGLRYISQGVQYIATEALMGSSTLDSWRSKTTPRLPRDYETLQRFARVCLEAAPELGETWLTDLFRAAGMAGYRDQALAEIFTSQHTTTGSAISSESLNTERRLNIAGTVPDLPDYYIYRHAKLDALKALLLARRDTGGWVAILGMTGVGKSTLLAALGHDMEIQAAFAGNVRWIELRQSTTILWLVQRIAKTFGQELPDGNEDNADIIVALRALLPSQPILLLLDNVANPAVIAGLRTLGPQVVVVVTLRAVQDVAALRIPEKAWVTIGELEPDEALALVQQIAPISEAQRPTVQALLALLEYHPYITVVAASAVLALGLDWVEIQGIIATLTLRSQAQRFLAAESINVWATLEMDWERLDARCQYALTTLGRLPYFSHYNRALAQAVWGLSAGEAALVWKVLMAMQLARPAPDFPGEYTVHWLIRDFAADKARQWTLGQRLRFLGWLWRYRLPFRLRWWWPALRQSKSNVDWPWYALTLPGTEGRRGMRFIWSWMSDTLWRQNGQQLNLRVGPVEWVTVKRLAARFLAACMVSLCLAVAAMFTLFQGTRPFVTLLAMGIAMWIVLVAHIDLRRAAMWWGLETSLPYTAAFTDTDQEKDPVS